MARRLIVGMTGASGVIYGVRLVRALLESNLSVALVISEPARIVLREELAVTLENLTPEEELVEIFGNFPAERLTAYAPKDFSAPMASGSYPVRGMIVMPCSMGTLGAIASGISQNLIHRAADCVLKEGRKLVLVPRETPLNAIHLENMLKLSRMDARIVPAMPAFYHKPKSMDDLINFVVGKVLDQLGVEHELFERWG